MERKRKEKGRLTSVIRSDTFVVTDLEPVEDTGNVVVMFPDPGKNKERNIFFTSKGKCQMEICLASDHLIKKVCCCVH